MSHIEHPIVTGTSDPAPLHHFTLPTIDTPDFGTVSLTQPLFDRWQADGHGLVGWPVADSFPMPGGGDAVYGESGMIVAPPAGGTFVVYGGIYLKYRDLGDVFGAFGLPISEEGDAANGGRVSHFANADVYWTAAANAHEVHGGIRARYDALGGPGGLLGYPLTDETPVLSGSAEVGRSNRFQNGVILWSPATDAWEVHGAIRDAWENDHKGALGELGFPVTNETRTPTDTFRYSDFQHGTIVWRTSDGSLRVLTKLEFYLDRFDTFGSDGFLGGSQDLYVKFHAMAPGVAMVQRMPSSGDYGGDEQISRVMFTVSPMRGDTVIHVMIEGWDSDTVSDDELGTVDKFYVIENLWGMDEDAVHKVDDFQATYKLRPVVDFDTAKFRENYWWKFRNPTTPELSWAQFAETYTDVDNDEGTAWHPFDHLFYSKLYKGIASNGNCFGMCWESLLAQMGHSIYREPVALVPPTDGSFLSASNDPEALNVINVKHGYQLGGGMVDYVVPMFLEGRTHDPKGAFQDSRDQWNAGDYPVLALTSGYFFAGGHAVRPYEWDDSTKPWRIYVCDPNRPLPTGPDPRDTFIEIDPDGNAFRFTMRDGTVYTGSSWSGGRLYSIPLHVAPTEPRTPFWEVLALLAGLKLILLGGDGTTEQIRDSGGRTFYRDGLPNGPQRWEDLQDDATRIPGLMRVPLVHALGGPLDPRIGGHGRIGGLATASPGPELYWSTSPRPKPGTLSRMAEGTVVHLRDLAASGANAVRLMELPTFAPGVAVPAGALEMQIAQGAGECQWAVRTPVASHVVTLPAGAASRDSVLLENAGHAQQAVTFMPGLAKEVGIAIVGGSPKAVRSFTVASLGLQAGARLRAHLDPATGSLVLENTGDATTLDVGVSAGPAATAGRVRAGVPIGANSVTRFAPDTWAVSGLPTAKIKVEVVAPATGAALSTTEI